jgi:hypothetical protein
MAQSGRSLARPDYAEISRQPIGIQETRALDDTTPVAGTPDQCDGSAALRAFQTLPPRPLRGGRRIPGDFENDGQRARRRVVAIG